MKISHWLFGIDPADTRPRESTRRRKWTGKELVAIRARNGVGRRHNGEDRFEPHVAAWVRRCVQVNEMYVRWMHAKAKRWHDATRAAAS